MNDRKILLTEDEMPRQWYNILADIKMNPPLGPDGNPIGPEALAPVFPMNLIEQEVSTERWIDIPEDVLEVLPHLASLAAGSRPVIGKGPGNTGPNLLSRMKASARRAAISPIPPWHRPITTKSSASSG